MMQEFRRAPRLLMLVSVGVGAHFGVSVALLVFVLETSRHTLHLRVICPLRR